MRLLRVFMVLALLGACSGDDDSASEAPADGDETGTSTEGELGAGVVWRVSEPEPLAQPAIVGDTAVVLGRRDGKLVVLGVALDDGKVLWEKPTSRGAVVGGIAVLPVVLDSTVLHFAPRGDTELAFLTAVDAAGKELWRSDVLEFSSTPDRCFDGKDVCVDAYDGNDEGKETTLRFDLATGEPTPEAAIPAESRPLAAQGLVDLGGRDPEPELLGRIGPDGILWQVPLADAFPGGYSTDFGWHFEVMGDVFVGSVGKVFDGAEDAESARVSLEQTATAAVDVGSGRVRWKNPGSQFLCFSTVSPAEDDTNQEEHLLPLRCRYKGVAVFTRDGAASFEGLDVTLEGFDSATGATRWSLPLGANEGMALGEAAPPVATETSILLDVNGAAQVVDLVTGEAKPPAADQLFWCWEAATFGSPDGKIADSDEAEEEGEYRGGRIYRACDAAGKDSDRQPENIPAIVGAHGPGMVVVSTPDGVVAYRM